MSLETTTAALQERAANTESIGGSIKFNFEDGSNIYLGESDGKMNVTNDSGEADCTVNVKLEDLESMVSGDLNPMTAFMMGKFKIDGNMGLAMKLQQLLG